MAPDAFTVSVPVPTSTSPSVIPLASVIAVVAEPVFARYTAPVKSLPACVRATSAPLPPIEASAVLIAAGRLVHAGA